VTAGVGAFSYVTQSTFTFGSESRLLAEDDSANPFLVVLEPASGFLAGGRILVVGDHNIFTENSIGNDDNVGLATRLVQWAEPAAVACNWGGFDSSRINYSSGTLDGSAHGSLRSFILDEGGSIAPSTSTLTPSYLDTVDVFYTSLLDTNTGELSFAEQTALQNWIAGGGTLIVTADIFPLPAYETFTSAYGVTGYTAIGDVGHGAVVSAHPLTTDVSSFWYSTNSTFAYGSDAQLLGVDNTGNDFLVVLEPGTGFNANGRIVVFGDHNMFTENDIEQSGNPVLAGNLSRWACNLPPQGLPFEDGFESGDTSGWSDTVP
jgi:hypothetical protein